MDLIFGCFKLILGLALGTGIIVGLIWLIPRLRPPQMVYWPRARRALEQVAGRGTGMRVEGSAEPVLILNRKGYAGRVEFRGGTRPSTDVAFDLGGAVNGWLQVMPESVAHGMVKRFGVEDIPVGDSFFDNDHEVSASSEDFARLVVDADTRSMLRNLGARGDFVFRLTPAVLLLRMRRLVYDSETLEVLVETACRLLARLDLPERERIQLQEVKNAVSADALCQICGAKLLLGTVVRCAKCRTPHHRDCWEFNGGCSTFACGTKECV